MSAKPSPARALAGAGAAAGGSAPARPGPRSRASPAPPRATSAARRRVASTRARAAWRGPRGPVGAPTDGMVIAIPSSRSISMKKAYATTLCNGEAYLPGVEALGGSLRASGTSAPLVLMVTPDVRPVTRERLATQGWTVHEIEPLENPN